MSWVKLEELNAKLDVINERISRLEGSPEPEKRVYRKSPINKESKWYVLFEFIDKNYNVGDKVSLRDLYLKWAVKYSTEDVPEFLPLISKLKYYGVLVQLKRGYYDYVSKPV